MIKLVKARIVREAVLDHAGEVERGAGVVDGREYRCWYIRQTGWRARVTNLWDLHRADGRANGDDGIEEDAARDYERLELFVENVIKFDEPRREDTVVEFLYKTGHDDAVYLRYAGGRWEKTFGIGVAPQDPPAVRKARTLAFMSIGLPMSDAASA